MSGQQQAQLGDGETELIDDDLNNDDLNLGDELNNDDDPGDQMSDTEIQAREQGWLPKDEFKGNPDDHKSAKHYVEWGEMQANMRNMKGQMSGMRKTHDDEIVGLNTFHKADTERQLNEVKAQLATAIDDGDVEGAAALAQKQADLSVRKNDLENVPRGTEPTDVDTMRLEWEDKNEWFFNPQDPRVAAAHSAYNLAIRQNKTPEEAFAAVDAKVSNMKGAPRINQNRNLPGDTTGGGQGGNRGTKARKLTMKEVPAEFLPMRDAYPDGEEGDKIFLTAVDNNMKGA